MVTINRFFLRQSYLSSHKAPDLVTRFKPAILNPGPDLVYELIGLILRFRLDLYASQDNSTPSHLPIPSRSRDGEGGL